MRAIVVREFGEPDVMKVEDIAEPRPESGEVSIRVRAIGINPVETYIRSGKYAKLPKLPFTPGNDAAGEVIGLGEGVTDLRVGDRVYLGSGGARPGAYAEVVAAPRGIVWPLPERLSFEQGAAAGSAFATAHRALFDKGRARAGDWILVHGASGSVGTGAIQMAAALGARVVGTASTAEGRDLVKQLGAEAAVDHRDEHHLDAAVEATGGHGFDLIIEMLANVNLGRDLTALAKWGRVVVVGSRGNVEITPRDLMNRDATIEAMLLYNSSPDDLHRLQLGVQAMLAHGTLTPVVGRRLSLAEAPAAHRAVLSAGALGKIVLVP